MKAMPLPGNHTVISNISVGAAGQGLYNWTIPSNITLSPRGRIRVKVTNPLLPTTSDMSDENFTIKGKLTINLPNGNEVLRVGENYSVNWTRFGNIPRVNLSYSNGTGDWHLIAANVSNISVDTQDINWTVHDDIGNQTKVKVVDVNNTDVYDESNNTFVIAGKIQLDSILPSPWVVNGSGTINWTPIGTFPM